MPCGKNDKAFHVKNVFIHMKIKLVFKRKAHTRPQFENEAIGNSDLMVNESFLSLAKELTCH